MIIGKEIYLRLMEDTDIPLKVKWVNDPEIRDMLISDYLSVSGSKNWFSNVLKNPTRKEFMICVSETDESIGFTSLKNIDFFNSKAEMSMLIGNKKYWGRGYAKEARKLLLDYSFIDLNLNRVYTYNWVNNEKIIGLNKKLGFKVEGLLKQNIYFKGEFRDLLIMAILKNDWLIAKDQERK